MKKILIPYDFTEASINAVKFAFEMFDKEAEFTILHVADGLFSLNDPGTYPMAVTSLDTATDEIIRRISELKKTIGLDVKYIVDVQVGNIVQTILKEEASEDIDAVVMSTRDKHDILDKLFGTISLGVVKRSNVPVYLIPNDCSYEDFKMVVIGTDYHFESDRLLENLMEWNSTYKADLHFVHVLDGKAKLEGFPTNIVEEYFEKRDLNFSFSIIQKPKGNVVNEIISYADEKKADLQIIITDRMTWLDTITSNSISKKMILKAKSPMLFIPSGLTKKSQLLFTMASV